jgi:hypothetical protein
VLLTGRLTVGSLLKRAAVRADLKVARQGAHTLHSVVAQAAIGGVSKRVIMQADGPQKPRR